MVYQGVVKTHTSLVRRARGSDNDLEPGRFCRAHLPGYAQWTLLQILVDIEDVSLSTS